MAAVCAGSLALAGAGLPALHGLTAGVAVGLLTSKPLLDADSSSSKGTAAAGGFGAGGAAAGGWSSNGSGSGCGSMEQELVVDLQACSS